MSALTIVVGSKRLSSWSLRAWLALKVTGAAFEEVVIALDRADTQARIRAYSSAGRVPVLKDGDLTVWDSLAIGEYLAERFPEAGLWPADSAARARARSIVAEMHAGFAALRRDMPFDCGAERPGQGQTGEALADAQRIADIWRQCRAAAPPGGPYLFGRFTIADAAYAPVVSRFRTYRVALDGACQAYADAIWAHPALAQWRGAAEREAV